MFLSTFAVWLVIGKKKCNDWVLSAGEQCAEKQLRQVKTVNLRAEVENTGASVQCELV